MRKAFFTLLFLFSGIVNANQTFDPLCRHVLWSVPNEVLAPTTIDLSQVHFRQTEEENPAILEVIPEFNPSTDLLFHIREDSHTSFNVGGKRLDWGGGFSEHNHSRSVQKGVVIRVVIGAEQVVRLRDIIRSGPAGWEGLYAFTCVHSELAYLQRHGIRVANGPRLLGMTLFKQLIEGGFADEMGNRFPQQIYNISNDPHLAATLVSKLNLISTHWVESVSKDFGVPITTIYQLIHQHMELFPLHRYVIENMLGSPLPQQLTPEDFSSHWKTLSPLVLQYLEYAIFTLLEKNHGATYFDFLNFMAAKGHETQTNPLGRVENFRTIAALFGLRF